MNNNGCRMFPFELSDYVSDVDNVVNLLWDFLFCLEKGRLDVALNERDKIEISGLMSFLFFGCFGYQQNKGIGSLI